MNCGIVIILLLFGVLGEDISSFPLSLAYDLLTFIVFILKSK